MKKMIKDTIDLDELNGAVVTTWISKLLDLQKQYGVCATITAFADEIYDDKGSILEMSFNRLETDEEYEHRIEREEYLKQIRIKDAELRFAIALLSNLTSK
jgi:hypothetical protein